MKNRKILFVLSSLFLLASCSLSNIFNKDNKTPGEEQNNEPQMPEVYEKTIKFSGERFGDLVAKEAGVQIDSTTYSSNVTRLENYCKNAIVFDDLLTSIDATKLNSAVWGEKPYLCIGTGYYLNNKFVEGSLKWNSNRKIYKVEIKAMAYAKVNSYTSNTYDYKSHVSIDGDDHSLEFASPNEPTLETFSKEYTDGVNSFTLASSGSRVLLDEITITWHK